MPLTPRINAPRFDQTDAGVTGGQPVPFAFTCPAGVFEFVFLSSLYLSDATVGFRVPVLTIADDTGAPQIAVNLGGQNAGFLIRYTWQVGSGFTAAFGIISPKNICPGLILKTDWTMTIDSAIKGPGDMQTITFQMKRL